MTTTAANDSGPTAQLLARFFLNSLGIEYRKCIFKTIIYLFLVMAIHRLVIHCLENFVFQFSHRVQKFQQEYQLHTSLSKNKISIRLDTSIQCKEENNLILQVS